MAGGGDFGVTASDEPLMVGNFFMLTKDADGFGAFVDVDDFTAKAFRHAVAIGVDGDKTGQVHYTDQALVNGRPEGGQRLKPGFFSGICLARRHGQGTFDFVVGGLAAPVFDLAIDLLPVGELAPGQKVLLDVTKISLDDRLAIGMANFMRLKAHPVNAAKGLHLRCHDGITAAAGGDDNAGIIDDAISGYATEVIQGLGWRIPQPGRNQHPWPSWRYPRAAKCK